jgi:hypothetical protein
VALRLGVNASYVSKCESGERRLDVIELSEFCRVYGTGLKAFLVTAGINWAARSPGAPDSQAGQPPNREP